MEMQLLRKMTGRKTLFWLSILYSGCLWQSQLCESFSRSYQVGKRHNHVASPQRSRHFPSSAAVSELVQQKQKCHYHSTFCFVSKELTMLAAAKVGIFYGTSTGSTQDVAHLISAEFGSEMADSPVDVEEIKGSVAESFSRYPSLIVGTPTWNTGADRERSGTAWDEIYYGEMQKLKLNGKKVAVFGLGDSVSYGENYADASGELHDTFQNLGCNMMGYTSQEGYEHTASKAVRGDTFCGLLCDNVNQEELTSGRVKKWVKQLIEEGILNDGIEASYHSSDSFSTDPAGESVEKSTENSVATVESTLNDFSPKGDLIDGYVPYRNLITGVTMCVSSDGRTCFYR